MPQSARTKTWQRTIDSIAGVIITTLGVYMASEFLTHPRHHQILTVAWAALLAGTGVAVVVGAILRTITPGRRQSVGFQFELGGWGGSACLIFWYSVIHYWHGRDLALFGALLLIVVMLAGTFLRLVAAMREGRRTIRRRFREVR